SDLREGGLNTSEKALFVLDGSKALAKGVSNIFGERGVIQRCILHKERNVLSYLPKRWQAQA
ncbi:MAG: IS256 family transposase, partial [bacterium]|nr:IS256 family transposase [bacterium]